MRHTDDLTHRIDGPQRVGKMSHGNNLRLWTEQLFEFIQQQLASIIKYVQFVTAPKDPGGASLGHYGPVPEGLVAIIIGLGGLVIATMWIGSRIS